ncbi:hypothetical protein KCP75_11855 [Salmonella enterica subsp. enterica]|nr:hypothetical protein KCP75_11855 [Salmonella enterica subsp. enterica]
MAAPCEGEQHSGKANNILSFYAAARKEKPRNGRITCQTLGNQCAKNLSKTCANEILLSPCASLRHHMATPASTGLTKTQSALSLPFSQNFAE